MALRDVLRQALYERHVCYGTARAYYAGVVGLKEASRRFIQGQLRSCPFQSRSKRERMAKRRSYKHKIG
jgi:hypothetical protein